jgi:uncharacterized protein with FMN-binding domain
MNTNEDIKTNEKPKKKSWLKGCLITLLIVVVILAVGGGIGWSFIAKEHEEAANLPLNAVNFTTLKDGVYHGLYEGGMYRWRYNECDVTVAGGKVANIRLAVSTDPGNENTDVEMLYERVVQVQSLQVDTISGATLTSKAYLQCVENALIPAEFE